MKSESSNSALFLDLPDEEFMLALCVRPENLADPAKWCAEMREHAKRCKVGPKTVAEAEELMANGLRLAQESAGEIQQTN